MAVLAKEIAITAIVCEERRGDRRRELAGNNPGINGHDIYVKARCLKKAAGNLSLKPGCLESMAMYSS